MTRQTTHWYVKSLSLGKIIRKPVRVALFCENTPTIWDQHSVGQVASEILRRGGGLNQDSREEIKKQQVKNSQGKY